MLPVFQHPMGQIESGAQFHEQLAPQAPHPPQLSTPKPFAPYRPVVQPGPFPTPPHRPVHIQPDEDDHEFWPGASVANAAHIRHWSVRRMPRHQYADTDRAFKLSRASLRRSQRCRIARARTPPPKLLEPLALEALTPSLRAQATGVRG